MTLADLLLKAKVNLALTRDSRISALNISMNVDDGKVTLYGDLDSMEACRAAEEVASRVDGVQMVENQMTCGVEKIADTPTQVVQRFLSKLETEWKQLPDTHALTQADYLRWALWMTYKFHIPAHLREDDMSALEQQAIERALKQISDFVQVPRALLALEMLRQAELIAASGQSAPEITTPTLSASPLSGEESVMPAEHAPRAGAL